MRVLFIGNSLTRRQDMPFLLEQIARNKGKQLVADYSPCRDGYKLAMHANTPQTMEAIRSKPWDYVVLQEHGLVPIRNPAAARRAVARFHEVISAAGARTILFEHSRSSDTNGAARVERQQPLSVVFQQIATELNVRLAPVGPAFVEACRLDPTARLFEQDHVHPSSEGAYLAACVLYATIFNETPAGTNTQQLRSPKGTLVMDLNAMGLKARLLEQAAWRAVRNRANGVSGPGDKPESNTRDQTGVGQLMKIAVEKGNASRPGIKLGICGEHGGDPDSVKFCDKVGLTYVSCSPFRVPVARLAAAQVALEREAAKKTKKK